MRTEVDPKAEVDAIITRLAEVPCPLGDGRYVGKPYDGTTAWEGCEACQGTGARFPWLWQPCRGHRGGHPVGYGCLECGGKGWVPRLDIRLEDVITELKPAEVHIQYRQGQGLPWLARVRLGVTLVDASAMSDNPALAFWRAVEKAVVSA